MLEVRRQAGRFELRGAATMDHARQLHEALAPALASGDEADVVVDLSGLVDIDLSGLQILTALSRELKGKRLTLVGCPPEVSRRISCCGLSRWLPL